MGDDVLGSMLIDYEADLFERNGHRAPGRVRQAFRSVRRDRFVREWFERGPQGSFEPRSPEAGSGLGAEDLAAVYSDRPLVIAVGPSGAASSSSSQPSLMMMMLAHLDPGPGMRVLEVGAGTGYNAALLAHIVGVGGSVVSLEIDADLAQRAAANLCSEGVSEATVMAADGSLGWAALGPYDRIIVTVGSQGIHDPWVSQLTHEGRIVLPLEHGGNHVLTVLTRRGAGDALDGYFAGWSSFVPGLAGLRLGPRVTTFTLPAGEELRESGALPSAGEFPDFWFFAGLEQPEATTVRVVDDQGNVLHVGPGLVRPGAGVAAAAPGALRVAGDSNLALLVQQTLDRWDTAGRPKLGDYAVEVLPAPAPVTARGWARALGPRTELIRLERTDTMPDAATT